MDILTRFFSRCRYRVQQFWSVFQPRIDEALLSEARNRLPEKWKPHFDRLSPSEKAHVLRLYKHISDDPLVDENDRGALIELALCHDFGKGVTRPMLFERVLKTLLPLPNQSHSIVGARILRRLNAPSRLIRRVRNHHRDPGNDRLLAFFQELDDSL